MTDIRALSANTLRKTVSAGLLGLMTVAVFAGALQPKTAFAALDDYAVAGGDFIGAFPVVGAPSQAIEPITLTSAGVDDFLNTGGTELINVTLNVGAYPGVVFDQTVAFGDLVVGGDCGRTAASIATFTSATSVNITVTGPAAACTDLQTITIDGLKIQTIYAQAAPGAPTYLIIADNSETSPGGPGTVVSSTTFATAVIAADAAATIDLAVATSGATQNTTLTASTPVDLASGDTMVFTMPANIEVVGTAFVSTTFVQPDGVTPATFLSCAEAGQIITCTTSSTVDTQVGGTIVMSGMSGLYTFTGVNEVTDFAINDTSAAGADIAIDTTVEVTNTTAAAANATIGLASATVGATQNTTLTASTPVDLASGDTMVFTMPANIEVVGTTFVSTTFVQPDGVTPATFLSCAEAAQIITCTTSSTVDTQVGGTIVMSGMSATYAFTGVNEVTDFAINDTSVAGADIAIDITVDVTDTVAAALSTTNVAPGSMKAGTINTATVTFTTVNAIPITGLIKVTFGAGFVVSAASGATCSTMDGSFATSYSGQVVTITRSGGLSQTAGAESCTIGNIRNQTSAGTTNVYTISTAIAAGNLIDTDAAVTADTVTPASSTTSSTPALTYSISLSAPVAAAAYAAGDAIAVSWSTDSGTGSVSAVDLAYSTDGGITYTAIVSGTSNDGSYTWTAPSISATSVIIRAQGTDLITVLASDTSDAFSIGSTSTTPVEPTDTSGTSTTLLPTGTYMKGASWSTVYYIDGSTRRPFLDSQTYFTYTDSFDGVIDVADDYLANYTMGTPMLPKAGTVLVKIQSVNSVYALTEDSTLRWITSESLASSLYGGNWADFVIDVPVTAWGHFTIGESITSTTDITVDRSVMQTRNALNSK